MITPWFGPEHAHWLAFLSLFSLASVLGQYIEQGRYRRIITSVLWMCAFIGGVLLVTGVTAYLSSQPRYVVFPLVFSGIVMSVVFIGVLVKLRSQYTKAEMRRITANDM